MIQSRNRTVDDAQTTALTSYHGCRSSLRTSQSVGSGFPAPGVYRIRQRRHPDGRVEVDSAYIPPGEDPDPQPSMVETFYAPAVAVLLIIRERSGTEGIAMLEQRLRQHPRAPNLLLGLPGLPPTSSELETAGQRWLPGTSVH
jgi:predicted component of type VI protein secretion system